MHPPNGKAMSELERIIMNARNLRMSESDIEILKSIKAWDFLNGCPNVEKIQYFFDLVKEKTERQEYWEKRARADEKELREYEAQIEASNKQKPVGYLYSDMTGWKQPFLEKQVFSHADGVDFEIEELPLYLHPQAPVNAIPKGVESLIMELALDLHTELFHRYGGDEMHPAMAKKYEAEMEVVYRAKKLLAAPQPDNNRSQDGEV